MRPRNLQARERIVPVLGEGPLGVPGLAQRLAVSTRTALRLLDEQRPAVISVGSASRRRYGLRKALRGDLRAMPLYTIDEAGKALEVAELSLVEPTGSCCDLAKAGWPVDRASRDGWWGGLPYPLYDMQPQGFLGRMFAHREHLQLEVPTDPRAWGDDDIVYVLSRRGADTSGNLIVGEIAMRLIQAERAEGREPLSASALPRAYVEYSEAAVAQGLAGSGAAGEFPKFAAMRVLAGSGTPHVIVKFSGRADSPSTRRWADLLVCEQLALEQLRQSLGIAVAASRLLQYDGRTFLESERFDRHGRFGRSPLVSLHALNGHLLGLSHDDWRLHAQALTQRKLLGSDDVKTIQRTWWFGRLIGNSDMHLGNLSFVPKAGELDLAPAYDMLPMAYAPLAGGEVPPVKWTFSAPLPREAEAWKAACGAALEFWHRAMVDDRISDGFRSICRDSAQALATVAESV
ncbi:MAG: type II toxin-antitoxin system HipA family toxin YjjJ [Burkholderiales bacterium]